MWVKWGISALAILLLFYLDRRSGVKNQGERRNGRFSEILEREIKRNSRDILSSR